MGGVNWQFFLTPDLFIEVWELKIFESQKNLRNTRKQKGEKFMAGVRTSLTEAQIESRRNHYLEKIGQGKPKAKRYKIKPIKNEDLARMLKARFGKNGKAKNVGKKLQARLLQN